MYIYIYISAHIYASNSSFLQGKPVTAARKAFYTYNANLVKPWDGPAVMAFYYYTHTRATFNDSALR